MLLASAAWGFELLRHQQGLSHVARMHQKHQHCLSWIQIPAQTWFCLAVLKVLENSLLTQWLFMKPWWNHVAKSMFFNQTNLLKLSLDSIETLPTALPRNARSKAGFLVAACEKARSSGSSFGSREKTTPQRAKKNYKGWVVSGASLWYLCLLSCVYYVAFVLCVFMFLFKENCCAFIKYFTELDWAAV